jgi:hypothetical protein
MSTLLGSSTKEEAKPSINRHPKRIDATRFLSLSILDTGDVQDTEDTGDVHEIIKITNQEHEGRSLDCRPHGVKFIFDKWPFNGCSLFLFLWVPEIVSGLNRQPAGNGRPACGVCA